MPVPRLALDAAVRSDRRGVAEFPPS